MGIGKRIKEARTNLGYTQEELANLLGITKGAIANYESETSHPKEPIMYKLIKCLNVDANYLFQDVVDIPKKMNDVTFSEYNHIKKYRVLPDSGKEMVDMVLDNEYGRIDKNLPPIKNLPLKATVIKEPAPLSEPQLSPDETLTLSLYTQLDVDDKGEIRGEMKHMLKTDKYTTKKELKNA